MSKSNLKQPPASVAAATKLAPEVAIGLMTAFSGDMHNPSPEVALNLVRLAKEKLDDAPAMRDALGLNTDLDKLTDRQAIELAVRVFEAVMHTSEPIMAGRARAFKIEPAGPSTDLISELNSLDFETLIGGPLQAVVKAQTQSSIATVDFINEVGFLTDTDGNRKLAMVDFSYKKEVPNLLPDGTPAVPPTKIEDVQIKVPLISIVNVPSLRIQDVDVTFNAKLNSVQTQEVKTSASVNFSTEVKAKKTTMNLSIAAQRSSASGTKVEKEYSLGVHVKMTQDEIPKGLDKVLNLLSAV